MGNPAGSQTNARLAGARVRSSIPTVPIRPRFSGDEADLFRDHHDPLVRSVSRALKIPVAVAEDASSVAWLVLLRSQPRRDHIAAWLRVVAIREAIRLWDLEVLDVPYDPDEAERFAMASMDLAIQARELLEAVGDLGRRQRQVLIPLAAGYSYDEIAAATGMSLRLVDRTLRRARRRLREDLGLAPDEDELEPLEPPLAVAAA